MLSAPNQCAADGPWRATPANVLFGSLSGNQSANTAERTSRPSHTTEAQNRKPRRRLRNCTSSSVAVGSRKLAAAWCCSKSSTDIAHPWVQCGIQDVDDEVDEDESHGNDHRDALDHEEVLLEDGGDEGGTETWQREDGLDDERPSDQRGAVQSEDGEQRERRRSQRVTEQDPPVGHALGLGR